MTIKTKKVKREEEVELVNDILCNRCGKSCAVDTSFPGGAFEYLSINRNWGYWSHWDGQTWKAQVCVECSLALDKWMAELGFGFDVDDPLAAYLEANDV